MIFKFENGMAVCNEFFISEDILDGEIIESLYLCFPDGTRKKYKLSVGVKDYILDSMGIKTQIDLTNYEILVL